VFWRNAIVSVRSVLQLLLIPYSWGWQPPHISITWEGVSAISTALTTIVLAVTAFFALRGLRETENTRYGALAADLTRRWDEPLLATSRREMTSRTHEEIRDVISAYYSGKADDRGKELYYTLQALPNFIETIAAIEEDIGGLSLEFVDRLWGGAIIRTWERWELAIHYLRDEVGVVKAFEEFERLVNRIRERRNLSSPTPGA
jgi:hypothetical protein